jgi:hypothetical protein
MIPGMPISASVGGGGPSGASSNSGVSNPFSIPFAFDNSGWVIQNRSKGNPSATGATGQASGDPNGGAGASGGLGSFAGIPMPLILMGVGAWLILRNV